VADWRHREARRLWAIGALKVVGRGRADRRGCGGGGGWGEALTAMEPFHCPMMHQELLNLLVCTPSIINAALDRCCSSCLRSRLNGVAGARSAARCRVNMYEWCNGAGRLTKGAAGCSAVAFTPQSDSSHWSPHYAAVHSADLSLLGPLEMNQVARYPRIFTVFFFFTGRYYLLSTPWTCFTLTVERGEDGSQPAANYGAENSLFLYLAGWHGCTSLVSTS